VRPNKVEDEDVIDTNANVPRGARVERVEYALANGVRPVGTGVAGDVHDEQVIEMKTGAWSVDEVNLLVRLSTNKYPMGTPCRWERISEQLQRRMDDVTTMIGRLKHVDPKDYDKLVRGEHIERAWSGYEQMLLEEALTKCPKSLGADRWTRIAEWLPGRTKEECIARYKAIVQQIKEKRQKEQQAAANDESSQQQDCALVDAD